MHTHLISLIDDLKGSYSEIPDSLAMKQKQNCWVRTSHLSSGMHYQLYAAGNMSSKLTELFLNTRDTPENRKQGTGLQDNTDLTWN